MIDFQQYKSIEEALAIALQHPEGLQVLASLTDGVIEQLAQEAVTQNWHGDVPLLALSARSLWNADTPAHFIAHSLWCAHREALWKLGRETTQHCSLDLRFYQEQHFNTTVTHPTLIICPMALGTHDAMYATLKALEAYQPQRKVICYGEAMDSYLAMHPEQQDIFASANASGIKRILRTLHDGGLFITYPDFVYSQHGVVWSDLFGIKRPFSSSFIKIAMHSDALLLPMTLHRNNQAIDIRFFPHLLPYHSPEYDTLPESIRTDLACLRIAKTLEGLILQIPHQWRLLPTITHESEE